MATPTILVTGATGTTGSEVVRQLSANGIAARALTRNPANASAIALPHIDIVAGDLGDRASLEVAMAGIDAIYLNVVPSPAAVSQIDTALAAAVAAGVSTIVKLSGLHASSTSPSEIIRMHGVADDHVRTSGLGHTILRANSFFQNIESQIDGIKSTGQFYMPMGATRQSLIDVADIAAVAVMAMTTDGLRNRNFDLTGAQSLSFADVAAGLAQSSGRDVAYVAISNEAFAQSLRDAGVPGDAAASVAELFAVFASGIYAEPTGDVAAILGREPRSFAAYAATLF